MSVQNEIDDAMLIAEEGRAQGDKSAMAFAASTLAAEVRRLRTTPPEKRQDLHCVVSDISVQCRDLSAALMSVARTLSYYREAGTDPGYARAALTQISAALDMPDVTEAFNGVDLATDSGDIPMLATIQPGPYLFEFSSYQDWVNRAHRLWRQHGVASDLTVCIDMNGRVCTFGRDFSVAENDGAYPVRVYMIRNDRIYPAGIEQEGGAA